MAGIEGHVARFLWEPLFCYLQTERRATSDPPVATCVICRGTPELGWFPFSQTHNVFFWFLFKSVPKTIPTRTKSESQQPQNNPKKAQDEKTEKKPPSTQNHTTRNHHHPKNRSTASMFLREDLAIAEVLRLAENFEVRLSALEIYNESIQERDQRQARRAKENKSPRPTLFFLWHVAWMLGL